MVTNARREHPKTQAELHYRDGAPGRTRTNTSVRKPDFESGASTNSATGARSGAARIKPMGGTGSTLARPLVRRGFMRPRPCIPTSTPRPTPDKPAYIMAASGETVTYRQLDERSNRVAQLFRALGPQGRRPHRALPREQRALLRDLLGRAALGPDLHRDQLAADRRRGRLHRRTTAAPSCSSPRRICADTAAELAPLLKGVAHRFMVDGTIDGLRRRGKTRSPRSRRRRSPTRSRATTCSTRRAPPAGPRACCRCVEPQPIDADNPLLADHAQALRHGRATRSISRPRRSITPRRCAST